MKELSIEQKAKRYDDDMGGNGCYLKNIVQKPADKIYLVKKYKCIASPRYSTFVKGFIYKPEDKFLCSLMNFCSDCFEPIEDGEQKPAEWSEEDSEHLDSIIKSYKDLIADYKASHDVDYIPYDSNTVVRTVIDDVNFLESLKDKVQPQLKREWSEEDEKMLKVAMESCEQCGNEYAYSWLKSLKDKYTWNPSDEQIEAIRVAAEIGSANNSWAMNVLKELYEKLKSL